MKMKKKVPTEEDLKRLKVESWGTWSKEVSEFDWSYGDTETCYLLEGEVEVSDPKTGEKIEFQKGDLVQFEKGLKCVWNVKKPVRKAATPKHDANATLITDSASLNKDENLFDDNFDLDAAIDELTQATEDAKDIIGVNEEPKITKSKTYIPTEDNDGDIFNTDAYEATNASK